ncbi:hypothetical protein ULMS_22030 [Patiriisocius marinistellae]|uniref:Toxin-antitoxin system YwqK family antitoxin n=1 Tax=Patiriisocius marinistellae TaxID=2494560 RepID=A0A5J4G296_9FLAO|nr:hypothetical protein [Patiriisocius marinistellae]GEQ86695.1 hypothetical protein ULMS_22030 [Patiriisocius marinistellae]
MRAKILFLFITIFSLINISAQSEINQIDVNGERHGIWKKNFPKSKQVRYEGQFEHGKEKGLFKFYCEECGTNPMATKDFLENDIVNVKYFTIKGKLVSEGQMKDKNRIGEWLYYHEKSNKVMTRENYVSGKLDGVKTTYYGNDVVAETVTYKQGLMEGTNNHYSYDAILLKALNYSNDKLHGTAVYYDVRGDKLLEGQYKKGRKDGVWKTFKDGKLEKEETFPKPQDKRGN